MKMRTAVVAVIAIVVGIAIGVFLNRGEVPVEGQAPPAMGPAVAGQKGGQDQTGPYEVVQNWPKPLSQLPGHEKWTWGAVQGIFAESPNRVFILQRGELPDLPRRSAVSEYWTEHLVPGLPDAVPQCLGRPRDEPGQLWQRRLEWLEGEARRRCALGALPHRR
jgi:hypothetical protein